MENRSAVELGRGGARSRTLVTAGDGGFRLPPLIPRKEVLLGHLLDDGFVEGLLFVSTDLTEMLGRYRLAQLVAVFGPLLCLFEVG